MSYVMAAPGTLAAAATDVAALGSTVSAAHAAAAPSTIAMLPAAADEVSASVARLFSQYAADYHALAGRAAAFSEQFVQQLNASAGSYAAAEAANVGSLGSAASDVNTVAGPLPSQVLDPLIGFFHSLPITVQIYLTALYNVAYAWALVANEASVLGSLLLERAVAQLQLALSQLRMMLPF
ncbi:PE family protein [Mycobacterium palustre]|uniref:PE domain-containing protein n=3 Tax=Mycobacterium palustre TaxID=153971 RepID=A0A1X1ZX23_9MYCO|nr:PE family protein [Mycobacterium palustre]ORW28901.1 hypothetical protein AWC19_26245 [Mycobacterium palustre]